jgi:hypothetical protein
VRAWPVDLAVLCDPSADVPIEGSLLARSIGNWHGTMEWSLFLVIGAHVATAMAHTLIFRDRIMQRMLPEKPTVGRTKGLKPEVVAISPQKTPGRFSLHLDVYSPPQVLQINGRLCHLVLAFPYAGDTGWQGHFAPRTLLCFIATTDPAATLSSSADFPVSPVIRPTLLRRFRAGTRRASPVA